MDTLNHRYRLTKRLHSGLLALLLLPLTLTLLLPVGRLHAQEQQPLEYDEAYYVLGELNAGLPELETPVNLQTPQAALEFFLINARNSDFAAAAHALNLNLVRRQQQVARAPVLAQQLYQIISQQALINWESLPDRPDGQVEAMGGTNETMAGQPRRSILLGTIALDGRDIAIRLQRVKVGGADPVWVFSSQTVENIPALHQRFGPSPLHQYIPTWAQNHKGNGTALWEWIVLAGLVLIAIGLTWLLRSLIRFGLGRVKNTWLRAMNTTIATPLALAFGFLLLHVLVRSLLTLTGPTARIAIPSLLLAMIGALTWLGMRVITFLSEHVARHYAHRLSGDNEKRQRQLFTSITVARQVLVFVALLLGVGVALSQFESLQAVGTSLLASAGVLGVIVGVAAQAVLGNIIAGMQIAVTQPVRIGDNVNFEGQWGYVEEITYTYVTIETWDKRRVIVPLKYLITHPIENWSKTSAHLIMPIYVYADYRINVDAVRQKFDELLRNDEDWDGETQPSIQVTAATEETLELRALCSASDPSTAWSLHCRMREGLVRYIRDLDSGQFLPRQRVMLLDRRSEQHDTQNGNHQEQDGHHQDDGLLKQLLEQPPTKHEDTAS